MLKEKIEKELFSIYKHSIESLEWLENKKGFVNSNMLIIDQNKNPIAICKFYPEDEIFPANERYNREDHALTILRDIGGVSPIQFFCPSKKHVLYKYVEGIELHNVVIDEEIRNYIKKTLLTVHERSRVILLPKPKEVTYFYQILHNRYISSKLNYPDELLTEFHQLIKEQNTLLIKYRDQLTYVHGDLVPPNIIFKQLEKHEINTRLPIMLIDWEFYRPELRFFDYVYFNYYAKEHNLPIYLEVEDEIENFYIRLIDVLERLWRYGYKMKHSKDFEVDKI